MKWWWSAVALLPAVVQAGPIGNGDFETGLLTPWVGSAEPSWLRDPFVTNGESYGINGLAGQQDDYLVLETSSLVGNFLGQTYGASVAQSVTLGGVTGMLQFSLIDPTDPVYPWNNHASLLLDNVAITTDSGGHDLLSFNYYALTKVAEQRNDLFQVTFEGSELFSFSYTSPALPTMALNFGGSGSTSYGTGWQNGAVTVPNSSVPVVPEPGTWLLLSAGLIPLARRRRGG